MKDSERLFELINEISDEKEVGMFDATLIFCENNNIEMFRQFFQKLFGIRSNTNISIQNSTI